MPMGLVAPSLVDLALTGPRFQALMFCHCPKVNSVSSSYATLYHWPWYPHTSCSYCMAPNLVVAPFFQVTIALLSLKSAYSSGGNFSRNLVITVDSSFGYVRRSISVCTFGP